MKDKKLRTIASLAVTLLLLSVIFVQTFAGDEVSESMSPLAAPPFGSLFSYQGFLTVKGQPADGFYDFRFRLYDALNLGTQIGSTVDLDDVPLSEGIFTVDIDVGGPAFDGNPRWLDIAVRDGASTGAYTNLTPRQLLTPAPYAHFAWGSAWAGLTGIPVGFADNVDNNTTYSAGNGLSLVGTEFRLDESYADGLYWSLSGNSGTTSGTHFIGTTDYVDFEIRANNNRVLYFESKVSSSPNIIGGSHVNWVSPSLAGATIFGGEVGWPNRVTDYFGTVSGGMDNQAGDGVLTTASANYATVSGGSGNTAAEYVATVGGGNDNDATGYASTIAGGYQNDATLDFGTVSGGRENLALDQYATVSGGGYNQASGGRYITIGGGYDNTASGGFYATVGGGSENVATGHATTISGGEGNEALMIYATVGGGVINEAIGRAASVVGGEDNTATGKAAAVGGGMLNVAGGDYATIPGGYDNTADGYYSFAAGRRAEANNDGCFVWGDNTDGVVPCNNDNRWVARASGGVYFYSSSDLTSGSYLAAGASSWSSVSDRNTKENFSAIDTSTILGRLFNMPVQEYNLKTQDDSIRHMGPVAQDFYAAFGLGESELAINMQDADGVSFAAIQGLYELLLEQQAQIAALEARIAALEAGE